MLRNRDEGAGSLPCSTFKTYPTSLMVMCNKIEGWFLRQSAHSYLRHMRGHVRLPRWLCVARISDAGPAGLEQPCAQLGATSQRFLHAPAAVLHARSMRMRAHKHVHPCHLFISLACS